MNLSHIDTVFGSRTVAESTGALLTDILGRQQFPVPLIGTSPFQPIPSQGSRNAPTEQYSSRDAATVFFERMLDRGLAEGALTRADRDRLTELWDQVPDMTDRTDAVRAIADSKAAVARLRKEGSADPEATIGAVTLLGIAEALMVAISPPVSDSKDDFHDFVVGVGAFQGGLAGAVAGIPAGPVGILLGAHAGAHAGAAVTDAVYQATESIFS